MSASSSIWSAWTGSAAASCTSTTALQPRAGCFTAGDRVAVDSRAPRRLGRAATRVAGKAVALDDAGDEAQRKYERTYLEHEHTGEPIVIAGDASTVEIASPEKREGEHDCNAGPQAGPQSWLLHDESQREIRQPKDEGENYQGPPQPAGQGK